MNTYSLYMHELEEWQMIKDIHHLDLVFQRAHRTVVGGGTVTVIRKQLDGREDVFEQFDTLEDLKYFKEKIYQFL